MASSRPHFVSPDAVDSQYYIVSVPVTPFASVTEPFCSTLTMHSEVDKANNDQRNKQELEERLILFGILIIRTSEGMPRTPAGIHLSWQMLRSGTTPALNYAEAKAAESHTDFTHKIKIVLKELRETWVNLRMTEGSDIHSDKTMVNSALKESNQLVAIFTQSVKTAERKSPPKT
jgi:four helix bundle protein